jgi:hypothetical protein
MEVNEHGAGCERNVDVSLMSCFGTGTFDAPAFPAHVTATATLPSQWIALAFIHASVGLDDAAILLFLQRKSTTSKHSSSSIVHVTMAPMDPEDLPDAEDEYRESSDEDFNPTEAPADDSPSSSEEDDVPLPVLASRKKLLGSRKRKAPTPDELDSGDEITIEAAKKRRAKRRKGDKGGDDDVLLLSDEEGGEGGLIKTRAQRKGEAKERRPLARTEGATVDVDALWTQMLAEPVKPVYTSVPTELQQPNASGGQDLATGAKAPASVEEEAELVTVEKIYTFAGQRTTEEKQVPRASLEQHMKDGWRAVEPAVQVPAEAEADPDAAASTVPKIHRPLRRPSRFDANPTGFVRGLPSEHQLTWPRKTTAAQAEQTDMLPPDAPKVPRVEKATKLNVVDKSRLDWTGFVHQEGIAEELDVHGKTKEAYLGRMQFLAGVEAKQEEERKRVKTTATA